jgi:hypothetical protein
VTTQDAQQTIKFPEGSPSTLESLKDASWTNLAHSDAPITVLEGRFAKDTPGFAVHTPGYLLALAKYPNGPSQRIRVLALARDGVYKGIWVKRATLGEFKAVDVHPANPLYDRLQTEADVEGITERLQESGTI